VSIGSIHQSTLRVFRPTETMLLLGSVTSLNRHSCVFSGGSLIDCGFPSTVTEKKIACYDNRLDRVSLAVGSPYK
jgi:hypothetical protein